MLFSPKARRTVRKLILYLGIGAALLLFVVVPAWFSHILTHRRFTYPDPNNGKSPVSYGLESRWAEFQSPDNIPLRGWYIPSKGPSRGTIIYCHGLNRSKVEMLPRAEFGHKIGYNGLLFDMRQHGQSGGNLTSLGYNERLDVIAAVRYALEEEKAAKPVILWGVSMGAVASLMAAADSPKVSAVISDSAFLSLSDTVQHHWKLFVPLPAFPIAYETLYAIGWQAGIPTGELDSEKAVDLIGARPILFVAVEGDRRMPPEIAQRLYSRSKSPDKKLLVLPGTRHGEGFNQSRKQYEEAVAEFLTNVKAD